MPKITNASMERIFENAEKAKAELSATRFETLLKNWNALTEENNHTAALLVLADYINDHKSREILASLERIFALEGHSPWSLIEYRNRIQQNLFAAARLRMGDENFAKLA